MTTFSKVFITSILVALLFIPPMSLLDEITALPILAALGYIWGFAPTKT